MHRRAFHHRHIEVGGASNTEICAGNKSRRVMIYGEGPDFSRAFAVLGSKARQKLFGNQNPWAR